MGRVNETATALHRTGYKKSIRHPARTLAQPATLLHNASTMSGTPHPEETTLRPSLAALLAATLIATAACAQAQLAAQPAPTPAPAAPAPVPAAEAPTPAASAPTAPAPTPPAQVQAPPTPQSPAALEAALRNFPPVIVGGNVQAVMNAGTLVPRSCPEAGSRVEQKGGPTFEFLGASPISPDLCRMKVGGETVEAWYGIWLTAWPGADVAYRALQRVINSRTGDAVGFDVVAAPGSQWHDIIRHDGIEDIRLLGRTYRAIKIAHYREGYDGNTYRSVSTLWKDLATGLPLYATYNHIAGAPEIDDPLIPTAIVPAPAP